MRPQVKNLPHSFLILLALASASGLLAAEALVQDRSHPSQVLGETRNFRIFLPPNYASSAPKRYPVIYWFHGYSERHNQPVTDRPDRNYDQGKDYFGDTIASYVGEHDVIVVKVDGFNPRNEAEANGKPVYPRPWNIGPVETSRQFPLYFPELVAYIDQGYRTIPDRDHRATAGLSMGGFMSYWVSGKYPHLVGSASNFMGSDEFVVGPKGYEAEYRHTEMSGNYEGVRTRIVMGLKDFILFYHQRMNAIWKYARPDHETETYDFDHGTPGMARTLDFHMRSFANPLPKPAVWSHTDVYPSFQVWGWEVASDRRQPGFTVLENVSPTGFRCAVREWVPGGRTLGVTKLYIASDKSYKPGQHYTVTTVRLRDGQVQRATQAADFQGRLTFTLDGEAYEVGIATGPVIAIAGYQIEGDAWATAGKPVKLRVRFLNKGALSSPAAMLRWETPNPSVQFDTPNAAVASMAPGKFVDVPLAFTVKDETREVVKMFAVGTSNVDKSTRLALQVPLFPPTHVAPDAKIADGRSNLVYQDALEKTVMQLGEGNGDGRANPGETFAVLLQDGDAFRAAELFTNDACVDNSTRISDYWGAYDHVGASAKYSLPRIRIDCAPGHVIRAMARVTLPDRPNHKLRYAVVEVPVGPKP